MTKPFDILPAEINRLNPLQLTQLLKILIHSEAFKHGIDQSGIEVASNITTGDGGEDGRISWKGGPRTTNYFPRKTVLFQSKASDLTAAKYGKEVLTKGTKAIPAQVKTLVDQVLSKSGSYVVFTTQELNTLQKQDRIKEIRKQLALHKKDYAEKCDLRIYDSSQIASWTNLYLAAVIAVQNWTNCPTERGLKTFELWGGYKSISKLPFVSVDSRAFIVNTLRKDLLDPKYCSRIVGLSGLGKSRTAYEVFSKNDLLKSLVVYIDANVVKNINGLVSDWVNIGLKAILVVDDCDYLLHNSLVKEVTRTNSQISLLTLDYNFETVENNTKIFKLEAMKDEELILLLSPVYRDEIVDLDRIVKFAQGFPQMAVLLIEARLGDNLRIGELSDDEIAKKLLWKRNEPENHIFLKILQACSLFDVFGIEKELESELIHIASILDGISKSDVYDCIREFTERGVIDRRGRVGQIVPKPLAIRLAAQWWSRSRETQQTSLINELPEGMVEGFCAQIEKLDFLPNVKQLTHKLCGTSGPFGQAGVILSIRGSRLFRSFVNVDPDVTADALFNILTSFKHDKLLLINTDVRRNLVLALEMLSFHAHLFDQSAWCMLLLASAENETYSNNATGMFAQLYSISLSGTAADPGTRFALLNRALELNNPNFDIVILKAIEQAVQLFGNTRIRGAEYQGTKAPLKEWAPKIWQDIFDFWQSAFDILTLMLHRGESQKNTVLKIIGQSISSFVSQGRIDMLDTAIKKIVQVNGKYWPEALENIQSAISHTDKSMEAEGLMALNKWLVLLKPDDTSSLTDKLKIIVSNPPWQHEPDDKGNFVDVAAENAVLLADQIVKNIDDLYSEIGNLLVGEQRQAYVFGKQLATKTIDLEKLLQLTLAQLENIEYPNTNFAMGVFDAAYEKSKSTWDLYIEEISKNKKLRLYFHRFIRTGEITQDHLNKLILFVHDGVLTPNEIEIISYGRVLGKTPVSVVVDFCIKLSSIGKNSSWAALNIFFMYLYGRDDLRIAHQAVIIKLLLAVSLHKENRNAHNEIYHWVELTKFILKSRNEKFAISISRQIISAIYLGFDHGEITNHLNPLLIEIMKDYGAVVWPIFGDAIASTVGLPHYWLKELLGRSSGFRPHPSVLSFLPVETVIAWCKDNKEVGPNFVALCINIFEDNEGEQRPTQLFVSLLESFGSDKKVINSLELNAFSRSWRGSLVPYLIADKNALLPLKKHKSMKVKEWVNKQIVIIDQRIEIERGKDEERDLR
jgi:hypothetical protein